MLRNHYHRPPLLRQSAAIFVLLLLAATWGVRAFHHHAAQPKKDATESYAASEACPLCDYLAHQAADGFDVPPALKVAYFQAPVSTTPQFIFAGPPAAEVQAFTNKGPPLS
ncbi:hypothetical protein C7T94_07720 [Pedobacter yulinensis]|uniref:DUF2946 domain-containing protein n=1 Tax=Pedobacter yulinensis TaxID=2126353 RepID=A0A2T3HJJ3_9SPHI|nr:hypothetical protein [Pedobacter yulinensis]PST82551.1 hypothetical protein C7T94_07720 [Pedobacter yulinensis]